MNYCFMHDNILQPMSITTKGIDSVNFSSHALGRLYERCIDMTNAQKGVNILSKIIKKSIECGKYSIFNKCKRDYILSVKVSKDYLIVIGEARRGNFRITTLYKDSNC